MTASFPVRLLSRLVGRQGVAHSSKNDEMRGRADAPCCDLWDARWGCPHEICPGCFCAKGHEQNVCDACHAYNMAHPANPAYVAKYGANNARPARALTPGSPGVVQKGERT